MTWEGGRYNRADRTGPKIFVGEWATREGLPTPNLGAALGDAAWMTGLERNSDLVIMSSYAPLLVNVNPGGMQWETDLIGYDAAKSYGSPAYYAQADVRGAHRGSHDGVAGGGRGGAVFLFDYGERGEEEAVFEAGECGFDAARGEYRSGWGEGGGGGEGVDAEREEHAGYELD